MLRYDAYSAAPPAAAWSLLARPARWPEWAPHVRGARGLGAPEVQAGRRGRVSILGAPILPATIVAVTPGRRWRWRVGPVEMDHEVEAEAEGCRITVTLRAAPALEALLRATYGPVVAGLVLNLARVAARAPRPRPRAASP